jgi:glycosyltransferase involved in cell wall biosynthesis
MPAYNAEKTLEFAAKSILNQTWRPIELIIIDDSSEDQTWSIIQSLAQLDDRVKVLRNQVNVGTYVSKNLALKVAKGIYITGHDADDWAHPERIERQVTAMLAADHPIKASLTRMIRLTELGIFSHFTQIGSVSDDGALRDASISGMFDAQFFKKQLGYWDSVRFGADSELIARARLILGEGFVKFRQLGMFCLDAENSLTNDPMHGVSKIHGISETRRFYHDQWTQWHTIITPDTAYIPFPQYKRFFDAPDVALVPSRSIEIVCGNSSFSSCASLTR